MVIAQNGEGGPYLPKVDKLLVFLPFPWVLMYINWYLWIHVKVTVSQNLPIDQQTNKHTAQTTNNWTSIAAQGS